MIEVPRQQGQRYGPTGGWVTAIIGGIVCALVLISVLASPPSWHPLPVIFAVLWVAWLLYLVLWRPRVFLSDDLLTLQGALRDREIAVSSITSVLIGKYTKVVTVDGVYSTPAIARGNRSPTDAEFFEERLRQLVCDQPKSAAVKVVWRRRELAISLMIAGLLALGLLARWLLG